MARDAAETRERILAAADALFYGEGILSVSVDDIAAKAGVTKRTLYYHFRSKDDLIAAYLVWRNGRTQARWLKLADGKTVADKIAALLNGIGASAKNPRWKGCGFSRAASELAGQPGHPGLTVAAQHKREMQAWIAGMIAEEGIAEAKTKARQIMVLIDGAVTQMLIHRNSVYAADAARAARQLLKQPPARR